MALVTTCAGVSVPAQLDTLTCEEKIDDTSTSTAFTVIDSASLSLSQYQVVQITDTATGILLYAGYIDNVSDTPLGPGNTSTLLRVVTCKDTRWLADKGTWVGPEFDGWLAGDVAAEIHRVSLAAEGVTAAYALRHDMDATGFGAGTLNGTAVVNGALTLSLAGADFTQSETTTANFNTGTLTNVIGSGGGLNLTSYQAIKYTGTAGANLDKNSLFAYRKIWAGSYTLVAGDIIYVDQWISSASPEIKAGIDIQFNDGTWMSDGNITTDFQDQWIIELAPSPDLSGWANDQWMQRACVVQAPKAGKVVIAIYLNIQGQTGGDYTCYFKNIKITSSTGITRVAAFLPTDTTMHANVPGGSSGYFNLAASVVTVYAHDGNRVSPARSITSVGVVKGSVISWVERDIVQPTTGKGSNYLPQVAVLASYDDGATWLTCTNHQALPGLPPGMNTSGRTITVWQQLAVGGCSPELAPFLDTCSFTIFTAAACTKTDYIDIDNTQTLMGAGTLTNCTSYADGVKTTGNYRNWDVTGTDGSVAFANQTLYGVSGAGNPEQGETQNCFFLRTDSGLDVRSRFDFAGSGWQDFIAEIDIHFNNNTGGTEYGFVYRTTGWSNTNNTYAYAAELTSNNIILNRAANGGTPAFTRLQTVSLSLIQGAWYRMKVVVIGSSHKVYINDVLYINWTDGTYTAAGYVGVRFWNSTGNRDNANFDNFGIVAYDSSLQSISTRTTAALPLALTAPVGSSVLNWKASVPSSSTLLVESTIDNGTTWNTCTNGGPIPLLVPGFVPSGASLKVRYSMTNQAIGVPIALTGHSVVIVSQYNASGTRVSPSLPLDNAGTVGASGVTWTALTPAGTNVAVASSTDNVTYSSVAASGNPIAGLLAQGPMTYDDFISNTAANYAGVFWLGGVAAVFSINTALSRMEVASGTNALIVWNTGQFPAAKDIDLEVITSQSETGGLVWRYTSVDNCYYVTLRDNSAGSNPNTLALRKRVAATDTQLVAPTTLPILFTRGTYHTLKVMMVGPLITVFFDGAQVFTLSDSSLTAAGQVGLRQSSATASYWYSLRAQQFGADVSVGGSLSPKISGVSIFPPDNVWNQDISQLPVHASSDAWKQAIGLTTPLRVKVGPVSSGWSIPYNLVTNSTPTAAAIMNSGFYDPNTYDGPYPIPASPLIEEAFFLNSDRHLISLNTDTSTLYEITGFKALGYQTAVLADVPWAYYRIGGNGYDYWWANSWTVGPVTDLSGNGFHASLPNSGVTQLTQQSAMNAADGNTSAAFNGTNGYIPLPAGLSPTGWTSLTLEWWQYITSTANYPSPLSNAQADVSHTGFHIYIDDATKKIYLVIGTGAASFSVNSTGAITLSTWQHIVITLSSTAVTFSINGVSAGSSAVSFTSLIASTSPVSIGWIQASNADFLTGRMSDVALYRNKVLTSAQILAHYNAGITPTAPFVGTSGWKWDLTSDALPVSGAHAGDAAALPVLPGLIRYDEAGAGGITHALRCAIPIGSGTYTWPAKNADGSTIGMPPHGSRLRLKAGVNISGYSATNQAILKALKNYGAIIADSGSPSLLQMYGPPDDRWNPTDINAINNGTSGTIFLSQFEIVDESSLMLSSSSAGTGKATQVVYTRQTLTSSDPTQNPVLSQLVTSVRGPDLMSGVLINATNYQYKNTPAACLSDVAQQSKFYWKIDGKKNKRLIMKDRAYSPAPWPLYSADPQFLISASYPQAVRKSPLYRNRQYVYNCIDIQSVPELKTGDGNTQSWPLSYPVDSIISLSMDGSPQTWGMQGVDTGKSFYYKPGTNVLAADAALFPEFGAAISLVYMAQVPYTAMKENTGQQAIIAAIDATSGVISSAVDGQGISRAAGDVLAQANIDAYANLSVDWEFFYSQPSGAVRPPLQAGHYLSVFVPQYGLNDVDMLITSIITTPWLDGTGAINYDYDVKATSGPNSRSWQRIFS